VLRLRFERTNRRLSQKGLGALAGMPQHFVSFFEIGRMVPTDAELQRLSKVLGVPAEDLLKDVTPLGPSR
jgi:transcriptional regulator with XRE-family HTH domain